MAHFFKSQPLDFWKGAVIYTNGARQYSAYDILELTEMAGVGDSERIILCSTQDQFGDELIVCMKYVETSLLLTPVAPSFTFSSLAWELGKWLEEEVLTVLSRLPDGDEVTLVADTDEEAALLEKIAKCAQVMKMSFMDLLRQIALLKLHKQG